jgi:hypothetical protein
VDVHPALGTQDSLPCADPLDCTAELQRLLDAPAHGLATLANGVWPTRALFMRSHTTLRLRNASLVTIAGGLPDDGDCLLSIWGAVNVTVEGDGTSALRMAAPARPAGEDLGHMHALSIMNSSQVSVRTLALEDAPGDGIYIGSVSGKAPRPETMLGSTWVSLSHVVARRSGRNGLSVIACVHCLIEDCRFEHTNGSEPMAGVDLEPNGPRDCLHNITFRRCAAIGNGGGGFEIYAGRWVGLPVPLPLDVTFEGCLVDAQDR